LTQNHSGASSAVQVASEVNENDIAALQAAERGALGTPVLIWFHAPWCEICQALKRQGTVTALEKHYTGQVRIVMVDISTDSGQAYTGKYRVFGAPTWVLFKPNGQVATHFSGWPGSSAVARAIDQVLANP
ncbi:MAG: thioredoxin family protein, partial [Chloroflexi bacterium]|nr:thioredoxin family protein [Chloroflexota bacterium]